MRFLIVDDHAVVRRGLKEILQEQFAEAEFGEAGNAVEALKNIRKEFWDIVVLDITMPGRSGLDVLKDAKDIDPKLRFIVLTMHPEDRYAVRALRAGADGYLTKETVPRELVRAIKTVLAGRKYVSASLADRLASRLNERSQVAPHEELSDREYEVMLMIVLGKRVSDISEELSLSVKTVSTYRKRILQKMAMSSNAELTRYALDRKLVN